MSVVDSITMIAVIMAAALPLIMAVESPEIKTVMAPKKDWIVMKKKIELPEINEMIGRKMM